MRVYTGVVASSLSLSETYKFVMTLGSTNPPNSYRVSSDGISWTQRTFPTNAHNSPQRDQFIGWREVFFEKNKFVANAAYYQCAYSSNGDSWTVVPFQKGGLNSAENGNISMGYGNEKFVYVRSLSPNQNYAAYNYWGYSNDGINWTESLSSAYGLYRDPFEFNGNFYAFTGIIQDSVPGFTYIAEYAFSQDGSSWTERSLPAKTPGFVYKTTWAVKVSNGNNINKIIYVRGDSIENVYERYYSEDGQNWVAENSAYARMVPEKVYYHNGVFVGIKGKMSYSTNGTDWLNPNINGQMESEAPLVTSFVKKGSKLITFAYGGATRYESTDGINWRSFATSVGFSDGVAVKVIQPS